MPVATSSLSVKRRPPLLPQTLPTTQAQWTQFVTAMQEWYQSIQSAQFPPNVLPGKYSLCESTAASYTTSGCTVTQDATHALYATDSLKVVASAGATLTFSGFPIAIQPNQRWYCAVQVYGAFAGSLALHTSGGTVVSSSVSAPGAGWSLAWALLDLTPCADGTASWTITFPTAGTYWLDGLQMSPAGSPFLGQPPFVAGLGY